MGEPEPDEVQWAGGPAVVTLPAEIDSGNADLVGRRLLQLAGEHPPGLVMDMTATRYCGCAGARALTGAVVRASVDQARERWPQFTRRAQQAGVASYLSAPLILDEEFAGSLNLYGERPLGFSDLDEALLRLYATAAATALAHARRHSEVRRLADQLSEALKSRELIGQAAGVVASAHRRPDPVRQPAKG